MIKEGSWWMSSESDKRWNASGTGYVGRFNMNPECKQKLEDLKKEFGDPPDDLEWGYMKD